MTDATKINGAPQSTRMPMAIIGGMFFIFGFVTWLNGPLITFVKLAFTLDDVSAFLVPMAFYMSYFFLSLPAAFILRRIGMKKGMALALAVMAVGAALFGQCVDMRVFPGALTALFIIGAGLSILQTASNPYISILGPIDSAAQRIAFMGICNKLAGALAPVAFAFVVMRGVSGLADRVAAASPAARIVLLDAFAHKVYLPYMAMAALLAVLAVATLLSPLPEVTDKANADDAPKSGSLFAHPNLWLGFLCIFLYVGVEVMAGDAIGTYGRGFGLSLDVTKYFTSGTLIAMLAGYAVGLALIPRFISQARYLAVSAVLGVILTLCAYLTRGYVSVGFVAALGFANAMMWPAIFPLGIKGLGRHTETGSAILVMGIAGGAVIPQIFAAMKSVYDFQLVFAALMVPSYLYILLFGLFAARRDTRTDRV
ncbi:sugar MFS transporter [Asticcacaulis sp. EMRT-3]|uniref:sugar MFS transporter n=1 Tax=Asticcacaulis sp. EMRT-3 TaxID=3040349 RepID=UPI0024AEE599|nr:sugar MFS transporter [Asticcacaulis sp. EMRT-3]MDI7775756.1 sugar MFS transporter [Asticcacaulis sp. EMRT-3]